MKDTVWIVRGYGGLIKLRSRIFRLNLADINRNSLFRNNVFYLLSVLFITVCIHQSCKVSYSFTGVSINPQIKTVSIQYFDNRAPIVQPQLSQIFTDALRDKVQGQTNLTLVTSYGDVDFSGEIKNYETRPQAITGNEKAALNRLTVTVRVKFNNEIEPEKSFDTSFSRYEDYDSSKDPSSVEGELINLIVEQLMEDIFNKAFVNW